MGEIRWQALYRPAGWSRIMRHRPEFYSLDTTSSLRGIRPEPPVLPDHGPPHVPRLPPGRVPDPVATMREPLQPARRRVVRSGHGTVVCNTGHERNVPARAGKVHPVR